MLRSVFIIGNDYSIINFNYKEFLSCDLMSIDLSFFTLSEKSIVPSYFVCVDKKIIEANHNEIIKYIDMYRNKMKVILLDRKLLQYRPELVYLCNIVFVNDYKYYDDIVKKNESCNSACVATLFATQLGYRKIYLLGVNIVTVTDDQPSPSCPVISQVGKMKTTDWLCAKQKLNEYDVKLFNFSISNNCNSQTSLGLSILPRLLSNVKTTNDVYVNCPESVSKKRSKHIVFIGINNKTGFSGGRFHAWHLAEAAAEIGWSVTFITNNKPSFYDDFGDFDTYPKHSNIKIYIEKITELECLFSEIACHLLVVIPHLNCSGVFTNNVFALAKINNCPIVLLNFETPNWFNALSPVLRDESRWKGWKEIAARASLVLSLTKEGTNYALRYYNSTNECLQYEHCYPAITNRIADIVPVRKKQKRIIIFSRFAHCEHKGNNFIEKILCEELRGYTLVLIVGMGDSTNKSIQQLEAAARVFGIFIEILFEITEKQKWEELRKASLLIFLSLFEGYGYPPIEALYADLPCVAFDLSVLHEVGGDAIYYVNPLDIKGMIRKVISILRGADEMWSAKQTIKENATFEASMAKLERVFSPLLNKYDYEDSYIAKHVIKKKAKPLCDTTLESVTSAVRFCHALLVCASTEYNTQRAINLIGSTRKLACLASKILVSDYRMLSIPYAYQLPNPYGNIEDPHVVNELISLLNEINFDEVYFVVSDQKAAKDISMLYESLNAPVMGFFYGDRIFPTLEALQKPIPAIVTQKESSPIVAPLRPKNIPLYAIIGSYNEGDLIYATVRHHFLNGADRVFLIDNNSTDNTRSEAIAAGAEIVDVFFTPEYNEMIRMTKLNDTVFDLSMQSDYDEIWWVMSDVDEFLEAPGFDSLRGLLGTLPEDIRLVGARQINYFPTQTPAYVSRHHPREFFSKGEVFDTKKFTKHCPSWHWKHPVFRWRRNASQIRARSGFHILHCQEQLKELAVTLNIHHFPFRAKDVTFRRYVGLCESGRNSGYNKVAVGNKSTIQKRYENLQFIYNQDWKNVYINPQPLKDESDRGVVLESIEYSGPMWDAKNNSSSFEKLDTVTIPSNEFQQMQWRASLFERTHKELRTRFVGSLVNKGLRYSDFGNIHSGKRCFVVGNGPSLNKIDMGLLRSEITFGSNRVYLGFQKWGFFFNYVAIQDETLIRQSAEEFVEQLPEKTIKFIPDTLQHLFNLENFKNYCAVPLELHPIPYPQFSASKNVLFNGWTVTILLMQIAAFMGCKQLILIGVDHSYNIPKEAIVGTNRWTSTGAVTHFHPEYNKPTKGHVWNIPNFELMNQAFEKAAQWSATSGVTILNATPQSKLDSFPKVDFASLF